MFDLTLRNPRRANWRFLGMYALMHGIEDSFSPAHADRDPQGNIVHLLSWTLIDWPSYFARGLRKFPSETHHAIHDGRDGDYLRADARAADGQECAALYNPYAVPESCLTERALMAVAAIVDLLVDAYRLRAQAAAQGRAAQLASPEGDTLWAAYLRAHLPSAEATAPIPSAEVDTRPRPDLFVGARATVGSGNWGLGLWGSRLLGGLARPLVLSISVTAGYARSDGRDQVRGGAAIGLLLPLISHFAIGASPAGALVLCDSAFSACTKDAIATLGHLIIPLGRSTWLGLEGPIWSWTDRKLEGPWLGISFGWAHERGPDAASTGTGNATTWDPPSPGEVRAFRSTHWTRSLYLATTAASTADNQFIGAGLALRLDRDRWNRRSGLSLGFQVEVDRGTINAAPGGALAIAPFLCAYLLPDHLALTVTPALVRLGEVTPAGLGADVAGRAGIVFDLGLLELAIDSPPLSYVSTARSHALPFSVRLGLLFE